jgi:mono/diheme cytochrome c family protein
MAQRIKALMQSNPDFEKAKFYLAMEAAGGQCFGAAEKAAVEKLLPGIEISESRPTQFGDPRKMSLLYAFGKKSGLTDADWTVEFNTKDNPSYTPGIPMEPSRSGSDAAISDLVQGEIVKDISKGDPKLTSLMQGKYTRGITENFGSKFSCLDDLGSALRGSSGYGKSSFPARSDGSLCKLIKDRNAAHMKKLAALAPPNEAAEEPDASSMVQSEMDDALAAQISELDKIRDDIGKQDPDQLKDSVARGLELAQNGKAQCVRCHSLTAENKLNRPTSLLFIPNEHLDKETYARSLALLKNKLREGFIDVIDKTLSRGEKPHRALSEDEREDVLNYIRQLGVAP